jgi:hypothetical protein
VSTFAIRVRSNDPMLVTELRRVLPEKAVSEIRRALGAGAPLVARTLLGNDHDEAAAILLAIVDIARRSDAEIAVEELHADGDRTQESIDYLRNVIDRHEAIRRQRTTR